MLKNFKIFQIKIIVLLSLPLLTISCSHLGSIFNAKEIQEIELSQDVTIVNADDTISKKESGDVIELENEPLLVHAPGFTSVLIVPVNENNFSLKLKMKPVQAWANNQATNNLLISVNEIQKKLSLGKAQESLNLLYELKAQYPDIVFLNFLEVTCLIVDGQRPRALSVLESVLSKHPNSGIGRDLYYTLTKRQWEISNKKNNNLLKDEKGE